MNSVYDYYFEMKFWLFARFLVTVTKPETIIFFLNVIFLLLTFKSHAHRHPNIG